ncbi:S41 family peptidase [bacterium]|nr:S41 family peptidase [bacterium]
MRLKTPARKVTWTLTLVPGFILGLLLWTNSHQVDNLYKTIADKLQVIKGIYTGVLSYYVDEVDSEEFFQAGINGMLNTLDPYTTYIEKEDRSQLDILTQGNYGGVGLLLQYRNETVTVADPPFVGTPSAKAGLREGDQIIEVDGESSREMGFDKTAAKIRGPIGSTVTLKVRRTGEPKLLDFSMIRESIVVEDVRYAGINEDGIGYILLIRFSKNAAEEVEQAIRRFKAQGMTGLILDLRSNPGGVLGSAVEMADLFLPKGSLIVSTRGRDAQSVREEYSLNDPVYGDGPLIVLTNGISASASEIVAGAIQDHDRGVVVGDTTFGKGLVQSLINLSPDAVLKITTAKYYTPSGRCIQRIDYANRRETTKAEKAVTYKTDSGREVHGGGGIAPDVPVVLPRLHPLAIDLRRKSMYFNFAVDYANTHSADIESFTVTDDMVNAFQTYLNTIDYRYEFPIETSLDQLKKEMEGNGDNQDVIAGINALKNILAAHQAALFRESEEDIRQFLRLELSTKFFGVSGAVEAGLKDDEVYQKGLYLLKNRDSYLSLLK